MATVPSLDSQGTPPAPQKKVAKPAGEAPKWYLVKSGPHRIPRSQGDYNLNRGKVISSASYPIQFLMDMGVELEDAPEPGWHKSKQGQPEPEAA